MKVELLNMPVFLWHKM